MKWLLLIGIGVVGLVLLTVVVGALLPREHTATRAANFGRSPSVVFAAIRDFAGQPAWRHGLKRVELLPPQDGKVRYREESRHGAITFAVLTEASDRKLVVKIDDEDLPFGGTWTFELDPTPAGTQLRITERGEVKNPAFRFLARFVFGYSRTIETYLQDLGRKFGETVVAQS